MAFSWSVDGPLVKLVSPITSAPLVVSTTTKLSDEIDRRLTASAGYDSLVHCQVPSVSSSSPGPVRCTNPLSSRMLSTSWTLCFPYCSVVVNGSSNAAHFTWSTRMCRLSGLISACSGGASKKYDGFRTTNWSSGALLATRTAADLLLRRPARPARCHVEAMVPG